MDISSLSSNAVSLIISVAVLLSALRTAETKLGSQLSLLHGQCFVFAAQKGY
nr:IpaC/SipC family type III secretion system effector [Shigella flexneri]